MENFSVLISVLTLQRTISGRERVALRNVARGEAFLQPARALGAGAVVVADASHAHRGDTANHHQGFPDYTDKVRRWQNRL